jgi:uncharacterized protein
MQKNNKVAPIAPAKRIVSLDVLRGFAILGILIMNIQSYSMIMAAYINPAAYGDLTGVNKWVWILSHISAEQKFLSIFSILFGAGIILFTRKAEAKGKKATGLHYRRTFWLLIIGLVHAYLLWYGDILATYALCALIAYLFRKISPKKLLIIGLLIFSISSLLYLFFGWSMQYWPAESHKEMMSSWKPSQEQIQQEIAAYRGGWLQQMEQRVPTAIFIQLFLFLIHQGWRAGGLMLVGMALFKWGVLSAQRSKGFYFTMMGLGFVLGFPMVIYGVMRNFAAQWSVEFSMFYGSQYNYWGSLFIALGYIGLVMLICKSAFFEKIIHPFAAVGRMALTNYLLQTVICTFIFYGHGLGLFGQVERYQQALIMVGVWILQLIISPLWLRYFRFGPAEWLWRCLTYLKLQPIRN